MFLSVKSFLLQFFPFSNSCVNLKLNPSVFIKGNGEGQETNGRHNLFVTMVTSISRNSSSAGNTAHE
jgi:hypothetical protein